MVSLRVFIKDEHEHRQRCIDGRIAEHEESIVNRNGYKVENNHEYSLNDRDDEASMDNKLRESS